MFPRLNPKSEPMYEAAPWTDARLVARAREGDAEAFGRLVQRHQDSVYNAVWRLVGNAADAEDIVQEVFVRAYSRLSSFEGRARFSTWLYSIMLNTVRSHWRDRARRGAVSFSGPGDDEDNPAVPEPAARDDGPADKAVRHEQVRAVRAALGGLDEDAREVIVLRDIEGLSYEEMAEALDLPLGTVKSRLHRARQALKERLQPLFGSDG